MDPQPQQMLSVLCIGIDAPPAGLAQAPGLTWSCAADAQAGVDTRQHDALLFLAPDAEALAALQRRADLSQLSFETAVVVLTDAVDPALEDTLLLRGVQTIVPPRDAGSLARVIRHAVMRKRAERAARQAYATDLSTGLPHRAQLVEHLSQLLALREREPAPMVLIVLRIEGQLSAADQLGAEGANILRRKVAVRLRSLLRASDVVAAIGPDAFGVLLGRLEAKSDGQRVAAKLVRHLQQPFIAAGQTCAVLASVGLALYPDHGRDADSLLRHAGAQAGSQVLLADGGASGFAARAANTGRGGAANDAEVPPGA